MGRLDELLETDEPPIYVADSAAFTENTVEEAADHGINIIARVPRANSAVDALTNRAWEEDHSCSVWPPKR